MDEPAGRWGQLAALALVVVLALVPWFSAAAVAPIIADEWRIDGLEVALLTVAVQLGFAIGALALALSGAADVLAPRLPGRGRSARRGSRQRHVRADRRRPRHRPAAPCAERRRHRGRLPGRDEGPVGLVRAAAWAGGRRPHRRDHARLGDAARASARPARLSISTGGSWSSPAASRACWPRPSRSGSCATVR